MTKRYFLPSLRTGLSAATTKVQGARPTFAPTVELVRSTKADADGQPHRFDGPPLQVVGPGDVQGLDRSVVLREEPPPGSTDAPENNLAMIEFADATLPWVLSLPGMGERPWLALLVLGEDEADLVDATPLPTVDVPRHALPDPGLLAAWAHVEARVADVATLPAVLEAEARTGSDAVVARIVCPRRLEARKGWLACLVPATRAGVAAALGRAPTDGEGGQPAWDTTGPATVTLPVLHHWRFRTGAEGSFEDVARRLRGVRAADVPGLGSTTIDVRRPWPAPLLDPLAGAPPSVTVAIQGALRLPGSSTPREEWSDAATQARFLEILEPALDAPGAAASAHDTASVAPPVYGGHHTGHRAVPDSGWVRELNLEVRHRLAASLGARYVQLEQEFLMERAWEQVGAVREANRLLAAAELAAEAARVAQDKHLGDMEPVALTELADPLRDQVRPDGTRTLASTLAGSAVPDGLGSTAFRRLARAGGALDRRTSRAAGDHAGTMATGPVLAEGLAGVPAVSLQTVAAVTAGEVSEVAAVVVDRAVTSGARAMAGLLDTQRTMLTDRAKVFELGGAEEMMSTLTQVMGGAMGAQLAAPGAAALTIAVAAGTLREVRRLAVAEELVPLAATEVEVQVDAPTVAGGIRAGIEALPQQLTRVAERVAGPELRSRAPERRPLRRVMAHPRFAFPVGAELLARWPDWTVPGISGFPENTCTVLETNPEFVEAALVGVNQELNRELLWREYPTDQAGTPFRRFWPGQVAELAEIAEWSDTGALGSHSTTGEVGTLVLLVRADVLGRFPGTTLLAVRAGVDGTVPASGGTWEEPTFLLSIDERTCVFGFRLTPRQAVDERWLFVLREPLRGTQFGFDLPTADVPPLTRWSDLTWAQVPRDGAFVSAKPVGGLPPTPSATKPSDPSWRPVAEDIARIAFQQPFQLAFSPGWLIR